MSEEQRVCYKWFLETEYSMGEFFTCSDREDDKPWLSELQKDQNLIEQTLSQKQVTLLKALTLTVEADD